MMEEAMNKRAFLYFYVVVAMAMLLASGKALARDFTEIVASGELRIAVASDDFLPWTGHGENNKLLGFEIDVATKLAEDLGVTARFIERPFDDLIPSLLAGGLYPMKDLGNLRVLASLKKLASQAHFRLALRRRSRVLSPHLKPCFYGALSERQPVRRAATSKRV